MPGDGGYWIKQQNEATLAAQQAAEKAATKKTTSGPKYIPRDQRVQTGPQPAANFTPNAANMNLVNQAYGNIGRASVGSNLNQIDQGGQNYWMNQLNSGAIRPQDFASIFSSAAQAAQPATANMYQNQALSQISGARPSGEAQQFYQPVYQSQYQNYARPSTQFDTSLYGAQPMNSPAFNSGMSRGNINNAISNFYQTNPAGQNATASDALNFMRSSGVNREDFQAYGGKNNYGPQMQTPFSYQQPESQMNWQTGQLSSAGGNTLTPELARTLMQRSMTTGTPTSEFNKYGGYAAVRALYDKSGGDYSGNSAPYPQQQQQQQVQQQAQFNPYTNQYQTPFSYQQPAAQPQTPFSYQQPASQANSGFNYSAPMQLPQYVYDTIGDLGAYKSQPVQAYQSTRPAPVTSSGPSQAIVGRSSQMRGTPNVMAAPVAKAKGGIASLLKKHK